VANRTDCLSRSAIACEAACRDETFDLCMQHKVIPRPRRVEPSPVDFQCLGEPKVSWDVLQDENASYNSVIQLLDSFMAQTRQEYHTIAEQRRVYREIKPGVSRSYGVLLEDLLMASQNRLGCSCGCCKAIPRTLASG
jgi:hypothetical protein